ncbi:MAG: hypothetical protein JW750_03920 [Anaerolineaceae bacterium]|nr:hypothetical protein [Anaerolineaceae bacterium]
MDEPLKSMQDGEKERASEEESLPEEASGEQLPPEALSTEAEPPAPEVGTDADDAVESLSDFVDDVLAGDEEDVVDGELVSIEELPVIPVKKAPKPALIAIMVIITLLILCCLMAVIVWFLLRAEIKDLETVLEGTSRFVPLVCASLA